MSVNTKPAIVSLIGRLGFIILLAAAIGQVYPTTMGAIIMFDC